MVGTSAIRLSFKSAAWISAALVMFVVGGWVMVANVHAQGPTQLQGQISNGTKGAPASSIANVPVTLFQITQAGPVTRTVQTDIQGNFQFTNVITDATAYFTRVNYAGIQYYSDIRTPDVAAASPITLTIYETQTLPANFALDRIHLVLDVQSKSFNGLQLLQVVNPTDRAFYIPLPMPAGAGDPQFDDPRETTRIVHNSDGSISYPILPTTTEVLYGITLPFKPPTYELHMPLPYDVMGINLLVSKTADVAVSGNNLTPGTPFTSQDGQTYIVNAAPPQTKGSVFSATITNLPGADNTTTLQGIVLVGGAVGGLLLLGYPLYRRRALQGKTVAVSERVAQLQAIAQLDDEYDAGDLPEEEYLTEREDLKAELLNSQFQKSNAQASGTNG